MRVGLPHLVAAALLLVVAVLVISAGQTEARPFILTDGFNGVDGSRPDIFKWGVAEEDQQDVRRQEGPIDRPPRTYRHPDGAPLEGRGDGGHPGRQGPEGGGGAGGQGQWYHAHPSDAEFMQVHRGP